MIDVDREILNTKQACEYLGVSPKTLRRWELNGIVKPFRSGEKAKKLFNKEELSKLVKSKRTRSN